MIKLYFILDINNQIYYLIIFYHQIFYYSKLIGIKYLSVINDARNKKNNSYEAFDLLSRSVYRAKRNYLCHPVSASGAYFIGSLKYSARWFSVVPQGWPLMRSYSSFARNFAKQDVGRGCLSYIGNAINKIIEDFLDDMTGRKE